MAIAKKLEDEISRSSPSSSSSMSEALLISTMCIIGLQVHVHIHDGSVFSGIFFTISLDNQFSIVLKNARLTKKGRSKSNVASGKIVETLVILSSNIVQIVAEGVSLSSNVAGEVEGENVVSAVAVSSEPRSCIANNKSVNSGNNRRGANRRRNSAKLENRLENKVRTLTSGKVNGTADAMKEPGRRDQNKHHPISLNHQRQTGARILQHSKQNTVLHQKDNVDARSSSINLDNTSERVKPTEQEKIMPDLSSNGFHDAAERPSSTENSQSTTPDENSEMTQVLVSSTNKLLPTQTTDPDKKAKEFKLNPGAKTFSPSLAKRLTSTHAGMTPVVANMGYVPSSTPMLPVPEAGRQEIGISPFLSHAPSPPKFVPYPNLAPGNTGAGSHFPQHMVGPTIINRGQPNRFTTQFHPVQATPMLVNPNPQMMVGRSGQVMYMQPIAQELVQGVPQHPHPPSRPLFSPQQLQYPKHQSVIATGQPMQLYAPQPFAASGHQPYTVMPTDIPVMQAPFPINRAPPIPVPNGFYGTKFL
ncbi:PREDICTED: polyadenylate-binding protein-interacting protein 4-like [Camelina sativa]|uniref:Polyadenylate-binding protein-interacting protein 4-like n=1 Tax=Camelina sativa TaxID=90675 RepID=A0ABM0V063_CAMSA|nr:PREDICTED: polyadenylate-binding protein-interacting protein 4-like [Camelina sativa]